MTDGILDTNVVVDILNNQQPAINWFNPAQQIKLAITPIVWMETVEGARNKTELARLIRFLNRFPIEHALPEDHLWTMEQFGKFHLSHQIGFEDILIASVAARLAIPLYTLNIKHFAPLPDVDERRPY
jgi:predicted nucleic acid-binding protein